MRRAFQTYQNKLLLGPAEVLEEFAISRMIGYFDKLLLVGIPSTAYYLQSSLLIFLRVYVICQAIEHL